ncbi:MAG TPA: efflux RND transporter periplasmic adaptor subunit [Bryobacteraceae bacterium]|nr:efflux RND transporter periplasmic adaptor subunit [Bryobacteraceae bacterium]
MRFSDQPGSGQVEEPQTLEARLRQEIAELKRQLAEQNGAAAALASIDPHKVHLQRTWRPSAVAIWGICVAAIALLVAAFFAGYIPLERRNQVIRAEAQQEEQTVPRVEVVTAERAAGASELELPGNIQAITEAPILARADGYIKTRSVDIGDHVRAGQVVAEIEAPELDQQVIQAKATLEQAQASLEQAKASYQQGKSNQELAHITAERWKALVDKGAVSRQDNDTYQAQYNAQTANLEALAKAVSAAQSNVNAAQANLARLTDLESYRMVRAPFDGVITLRNVDVGTLVTAGNTLLFRIAQTGTLRIYVDVPQSYSEQVHTGLPARITVPNLPGRVFPGTVTRMANSLDPASRTMLVEVQVPNRDGSLFPGMYARVDLRSPRGRAVDTPILIPGDAIIARGSGTQVAVVGPDHMVHIVKVEVGRDYGDRLEIVSGLQEGDSIIAHPGDTAREGALVNPVQAAPQKQKGSKDNQR